MKKTKKFGIAARIKVAGGIIALIVSLVAVGTVNARDAIQDHFGYRYVDSISGGISRDYEPLEKNFEGIKYSGFDKPEFDFPNLMGPAIPLGFTFEFYGKKYQNVYVAGNGYIQFTPDNTFRNYVYDGSGLPSQNNPNNIIAPLWGWHDTFS